ncbi:MAG TPA: class I SAM-dependent methyltransferase [Polyangia bacterium]|jgi:2-polyprenyl-3-methyl-5-hydroxy-6-metoxy-1,4-benzoquinol methylase
MSQDKRSADLPLDDVQQGNKRWWTENTMSYDWHNEVTHPRFSLGWFDAIDQRFLAGAHLYGTGVSPFDRIIPFEHLRGKDVLEIGCGMGLHTELMVRAGARVTAIDLSPTSVEATRKRLALKDLKAEVVEGDAEKLPFDAGSFDFVWSWGVIHHSSSTGRVVRQIARVSRPAAECRIMVYNRASTWAYAILVRDYLLKGQFLRRSFEETLYRSSDGFTARFYVQEQFEDLFRAFFQEVGSEIMGQESDVVPLPRQLRRYALGLLPASYQKSAQARWGSFIFLTARRPISA